MARVPADSERYWDARAKENALWFVDTGIDRDDPDADEFWRRGEGVVENMFAIVGMAPSPEDVVVDIGCGVGRLTRALAARCARVYGVDVSSEMLARARELNPHLENVEWVHGDGRGLGVFGDASVDGCFSHVVFQHIPDPAVTLHYVREMGRVLRPGGWALFQVSTDPSVHVRSEERPSDSLRARAAKALRAVRPEKSDAWYGSAVTVGDVRAAADAGGAVVEQVHDEGSQYTTVLLRSHR